MALTQEQQLQISNLQADINALKGKISKMISAEDIPVPDISILSEEILSLSKATLLQLTNRRDNLLAESTLTIQQKINAKQVEIDNFSDFV